MTKFTSFLLKAILKHKRVVCMRRRLFTIYKYLIFKFVKYANKPSDNIKLNRILNNSDENDISSNSYQTCLILFSNILLDVLHKMSTPVLLPWQRTKFQTSLILKLCCRICMIQQAYKCVRSSLWPF